MARFLEGLGRQAWRSSPLVTRGLLPGEFRSLYRFPTGLERDAPRAFTADDDARYLDTRHVPPSLAIASLGEAMLRGETRLVQSIHHAESEFVLLLDLSQSMFSGCFAGGGAEDWGRPARTKLQALYTNAAAYLSLAEATHFAVRVIFVHGDVPEQRRARTPRGLMPQVLAGMTERLNASYRRAEEDPGAREGFLLGPALNLASAVRARSVVAVISDFLDPPGHFHGPLCQALARHHVALVDVAADHDRRFPRPRWWELDRLKVATRDGARHLEEGTQERPLDGRTIREWNARRQADHAALEGLARRFDAQFVTGRGASVRDSFAQALQVFARIR